MKKLSASTKIYILLVLTCAVSNAIQVFLPSYLSMLPPATQLPAPIPMLALANAGIALVFYGVVSIFAAYYMRKWGFLAAAGIHFWTDIVWHVIWGLF